MPLSERERAVCEWIAARRQAMVDELAAWVAIPTGRGFAPGLHRQRALLAARLRALGAVTHDAPCDARPDWLEPGAPPEAGAPAERVDVLVGHRAGGSGPRVLLSGHFDTVHDPHSAFRELRDAGNGRATGPGCADMKGGLVVAFTALEALQAAGAAFPWSFVLTPDEETGSFGSAAELARLAGQHDVGFVFEPAGEGGTLITERMGAGQFRIDAYGRTAHAGRDYAKGVSAVRALCRAVLDAEAAGDGAARIVNVGPLEGGALTNAVPDHAAAWGNVRFAAPADEAALAAALDALDRGAEGEVPRVRVRRTFNRPAKPCTDAVRALADRVAAASRDLGRELPFGRTGGVCDGNLLQAAGLPCVDTLGVRGGNLHREDEFVELDSLVDRAQLAAVVLLRTVGA
jgi:glutamate carboxypeptidase